MFKFKDLIDAVHDIKRTVESDGEKYVPEDQTVRLTQQQYDEVVQDPYLDALPPEAKTDLTENKKVLGATIDIPED